MLKSLAKHLSGIALTWVLVLAGTFFLLRWYSQPSAEREVPVGRVCPAEAAETLQRLGLASGVAGFDLCAFRHAGGGGRAASPCGQFCQGGAEHSPDHVPHHASE